nr:MAG TPA: hypothetical protein [Bacteriophage sp.]DAJ07010.1 MAG TPA: hypothetical protein [Caudoviricetes sp.]DAM82351.1 MAG TPA: hypothetical protein [Caudoviricetes sp.]
MYLQAEIPHPLTVLPVSFSQLLLLRYFNYLHIVRYTMQFSYELL